MIDDFHQPVMVDESLSYLVTRPDGTYIDATVGGGSHTLAIVGRLTSSGRVLAIDRDDEAIARAQQRVSRYSPQITLARGEFSSLKELAFDAGIASVNGAFFDLGVSSHQLDHADRGFSYQSTGPLDCRMDRRGAVTAADIVNGWPAEELTRALFEYGEEKNARKIVAALITARSRKPFATTAELAAAIASVTNPRYVNRTLSRCFQAIRLVVNDELNQLRAGLAAAFELLDTFGRLVVISYHSLEDRIVKNFIRDRRKRPPWEKPPSGLRMLTKKPVRPQPEEIRANPRARSARLRAAEKV